MKIRRLPLWSLQPAQVKYSDNISGLSIVWSVLNILVRVMFPGWLVCYVVVIVCVCVHVRVSTRTWRAHTCECAHVWVSMCVCKCVHLLTCMLLSAKYTESKTVPKHSPHMGLWVHCNLSVSAEVT